MWVEDVVHLILFQFMSPSWLPHVPAAWADTEPLLFRVRQVRGDYDVEIHACVRRGDAERVYWLLSHNAAKLSVTGVVDAARFCSSTLFWRAFVPAPAPWPALCEAVRTGSLEWTRTVAFAMDRTDPHFGYALLMALRLPALDIACWLVSVMHCAWPDMESCLRALRASRHEGARHLGQRWVYMNHPLCKINESPLV